MELCVVFEGKEIKKRNFEIIPLKDCRIWEICKYCKANIVNFLRRVCLNLLELPKILIAKVNLSIDLRNLLKKAAKRKYVEICGISINPFSELTDWLVFYEQSVKM